MLSKRLLSALKDMGVEFVGVTSSHETSVTNHTLAPHGSVLPGDLVVAMYVFRSTSRTISMTDFTRINPVAAGSQSGDTWWIGYRYRESSDGSYTTTANLEVNESFLALLVFRNAKPNTSYGWHRALRVTLGDYMLGVGAPQLIDAPGIMLLPMNKTKDYINDTFSSASLDLVAGAKSTGINAQVFMDAAPALGVRATDEITMELQEGSDDTNAFRCVLIPEDYAPPSTVESVGWTYAATTNNTEDLVLDVPSGVQEGDLMLFAVHRSAGSITLPSGWNIEVSDAPRYVLSRVAGASEPSSYTVSLSGSSGVVGNRIRGAIMAYRNAEIATVGTSTTGTAPINPVVAAGAASNDLRQVSVGMNTNGSAVSNNNTELAPEMSSDGTRAIGFYAAVRGYNTGQNYSGSLNTVYAVALLLRPI